jgi:glycosyltransferase involved in cell wall biosynthesis
MTTLPIQAETWLTHDAPIVPGLVSVIIPNYNHADYLPNAIDSVLQQVYEPVEVIVVDDGSTDHSGQVAARYGSHIHYIWQENRGLSAARNTGLRAAKGEYIALLDADDMLEPDFMAILVGLLADNPAVDGVICGYRFVDDEMNPLPQAEARDLPAHTLYATLLDGNFLVPESILLRRHCYIVAGPFDEKLRACEDWDMWLRISRQFTIISTPRLLTRHRILPGSMSSNPERMLTNRLIVLNRHFGAEPKNAKDGEPAQRRAYARAYVTSALEYLQARNLDRVYYCLSRMAYIVPHLTTELNIFYELGLGDQPKGQRGHFASLDLARNEQQLMQLLSDLFTNIEAIQLYRRDAYAQAHFALALLYYGARQPAQARRHLWRSLSYRPRQAADRQWRNTLLRTLLPGRLLHAWRATRVKH